MVCLQQWARRFFYYLAGALSFEDAFVFVGEGLLWTLSGGIVPVIGFTRSVSMKDRAYGLPERWQDCAVWNVCHAVAVLFCHGRPPAEFF